MFLMRKKDMHPSTHHDMANCPVEGSDIFLHLSCVMDDMMSIVKTVLLHLRLQTIMQGQEKTKEQEKSRTATKLYMARLKSQ